MNESSPVRVSRTTPLRTWLDAWFGFRNRMLSSARFQRWAARFPLTRFIARRRASALFDLCAGFVYSQVVFATVRLRLLEAVADEPRTATELAPRLDLPLDAASRLLDAAASLKLLEHRSQGRYGLGIHGASLLGNPSVARMVEHHSLFYRDLADPIALLRGARATTELNDFWSYARKGVTDGVDPDVAGYSELMAGSLTLLAEDILEAYPPGRHRCLLDVGGGDGAFLEAVAASAPDLKLMLFDLPEVARRARARLDRAGISSRTTVVGGDVFGDPLPVGADVVSLVRVVHDHDDPQALRILQAVRKALPPGGVVLVAEPMAGTPGAEAMASAYFGLYLLAMGQGRPRTPDELGSLLTRAGFVRVQRRQTRRPMLSQLVLAFV